MATIKKACKGVSYPKSSSVSKRIGSPSKAKKGGSFPDLNKDGKITKADVLKGRGVIAKKGMKVKKAQDGKVQGRGTSGDRYSIDTTGYSAGAKKFPANVSRTKLSGKTKEFTKDVSRGRVDQAINKKRILDSPTFKKGGKMTKKCAYGCK